MQTRPATGESSCGLPRCPLRGPLSNVQSVTTRQQEFSQPQSRCRVRQREAATSGAPSEFRSHSECVGPYRPWKTCAGTLRNVPEDGEVRHPTAPCPSIPRWASPRAPAEAMDSTATAALANSASTKPGTHRRRDAGSQAPSSGSALYTRSAPSAGGCASARATICTAHNSAWREYSPSGSRLFTSSQVKSEPTSS